MLLSKGLAKLNSVLLCCLLLLSPWAAPPSAMAATRKGDKFLKDGRLAEAKGDYEKALELFEQALATDPRDSGYRIAVNRSRFQAAQKIVDRGEKLMGQNKPEEALTLFQRAFALDPASTIAEQRMRQAYEQIKKNEAAKKKGETPEDPGPMGFTPADRVRQEAEKRLAGLMDAPVLKPIQRQIVNLKLNNQPARVLYETIGKLTGINVLFDPDFISQNSGKTFPIDFQNTTLEEALDYLGILTKAYWKPISANAIYITLDNPQKRRDYEDYILKVFYLQHALEPQELNEIANAVRVVGECRKVVPYPAQMALMVRCTSDQVALVSKIINDMDKPRSEVVLDVYVLEANRTRTRSLAATIANGVQTGIRQQITFTPRNPRLTGGSGSDDDSNGGNTTSNLIALSQVGKISTNDFSINLPGAFLQALLEDRQTRVLQNPQVRTVDNKKASLRIGDRFPYATGSLNTGGVGGVGGISPLVQTQFQFAEVGVNVDITPKIHGNEEISLRVEVEVSNIRDQVDIGGLRQPVIGQRKIGEDIRIKEGEVNVMGGLTTTNASRNRTGIPWLIDIPGLSWLFGTDGKDQSDSELLIILVPHLVRAPELTDLNLRGISTGTDTTVKLTYTSREDAPAAASAPAAAPTTTAPITTAPMAAPPRPAPQPFPILVPQQAPAQQTPPAQAPPPAPKPAAPPVARNPINNGLSAVPAASNITALNSSTRIGRPVSLRNKLQLRPQQSEVFLSGPVTIQVDVEYGEDIAAAPLVLEYDQSLLKLIGATSGGLLSIDGQKEKVEVDLNKGRIHLERAVGAGGVSGNGTLAKLTFATLAKGEASVRILSADMVNSRKEPLAGAPLPEVTIKIQ
ncbi:MAG: cohesin domain-containing protein [Bryobacter sp.]|nr:cohesin domain-containing protein [Bryobacter sp.]